MVERQVGGSPRRICERVRQLLNYSSAVVLLGPPQVGKTTLALEVSTQRASVYLDLEDENDRAKLVNPARYLEDHQDELVILDEVHRVPELFQQLRQVPGRLLVTGEFSAEDLAMASHAHPTLADVIKEAALAVDGRAIHI